MVYPVFWFNRCVNLCWTDAYEDVEHHGGEDMSEENAYIMAAGNQGERWKTGPDTSLQSTQSEPNFLLLGVTYKGFHCFKDVTVRPPSGI